MDKEKQVSLVFVSDIDFDEFKFIKDLEKFTSKYKGIRMVGKHIKNLEKREN